MYKTLKSSEQRNPRKPTMDVWSWICELPDSEEWYTATSSLTLQLATSKSNHQSIQLRAERAFPDQPNSEAAPACSLTFSLQYLHSSSMKDDRAELSTLWVSDTCHLSQDQPFLPLILQLLQEIISRSPNAHLSTTTCPRSQLRSLKPDPVSWILGSHSPESFSNFFNLIFLTRLFWLCAFEAPSEVGAMYFYSLLAPNLETFSCRHAAVLRTFFASAGADVELSLMRTLGHMLAKSLIFREMGAGVGISKAPAMAAALGLSYAMESHGMWILKGYIPVTAMKRVLSSRPSHSDFEPKESVLRYALAHQQLEAVIQLEYTVGFCDGFIQVHARVDNIRLHVVNLGFKTEKEREGDEDNEAVNRHHASILKERHFPSRVRVWVGPEVGANYVGSLSLGRSTDNVEREVEMQKIVKGSFKKFNKAPKVEGMAGMATRTKIKNWRWDQDVEGNAAIFDGILCDNATGVEVATWKPPRRGGGGGETNFLVANYNFTRRYNGGSRAFTKSGGVVFTGEECGGGGGGAGWRLSKDMEGSVLKWRIGGEVWLSYWPNEVRSSYYETRSVEFCDEVDLPLIPGRCI